MEHDVLLRAAVRAIFDARHPSGDWSRVRFGEAERRGTIHYRQAVLAAVAARVMPTEPAAAPLALL